MKSLDVPAELKVEAEGKLYSVPEGVEYNTPTSQASAENWWKEFVRKVKEMVNRDSEKAKKAGSDPSAEGETLDRNCRCPSDSDGRDGKAGKDLRSVGEHSCQICFEQNHSTVMLPCGHGGLCWDCGLQIYAMTEECPMCRTKIELLVKVDGKKRRYEGLQLYIPAHGSSETRDGLGVLGHLGVLPRRDMEQAQHTYQRRASTHDDLEESRSRHEQLRSSMFSSVNPRDVAPASRLLTRGGAGAGSGGGGGGGGSLDSSEDTTAARIDAAIKAAMAVDSTRGANTFNHLSLTPPDSSTTSISVEGGGGGSGGINFTPAMAPPGQGGGGGGGVSVIPQMPANPVSRGSGSGNGAYRMYHPQQSSGSHSSMPGLVGMTDSTGTGYTARTAGGASAVDESVASRSLGGSSGGGSLGGSGDVNGNGTTPADPYAYGSYAGGHARNVGSGGSGGGGQQPQQQQQPTKSVWERGGGAPTPKAVWHPEPPAPATVVPGSRGDDFSSGSSGAGAAAGQGVGQPHHRQSRDGGHDYDHCKTGSSGALLPPDQRSPDLPPVEAASAGGSAIGQGGMVGGGEGVEITPRGYEPPLELPDGCHHISLEKFLEVMTGPGLRVRKHHRTGKGSSGLRVLRYNQEGDNLTWDSHKILGAAQHVLPMSDVESVSMQPGNRVVLKCVGGKDSYAMFEAANDDAAAVLYVGLERLRERTQARKASLK
eukprot:g10981.t1